MGPHGGTASEIADALGVGWDNVIVSRRIAGLRLNHIVSLDGGDSRPLVTRPGPSGRPQVVHVARQHYARRAA
jgi:hypothetical protein